MDHPRIDQLLSLVVGDDADLQSARDQFSRSDGESRCLSVGRGITLSGEVNSCDKLLIEGSVDAKLTNCRAIEIAESGLFKGSTSIDEAEIRGRFEGDLTVRNRLLIKATETAGTIGFRGVEANVGNPDYYKLCKSLFPCGSPLESTKGWEDKLESNIDKAKALLKEAGIDVARIRAELEELLQDWRDLLAQQVLGQDLVPDRLALGARHVDARRRAECPQLLRELFDLRNAGIEPHVIEYLKTL